MFVASPNLKSHLFKCQIPDGICAVFTNHTRNTAHLFALNHNKFKIYIRARSYWQQIRTTNNYRASDECCEELSTIHPQTHKSCCPDVKVNVSFHFTPAETQRRRFAYLPTIFAIMHILVIIIRTDTSKIHLPQWFQWIQFIFIIQTQSLISPNVSNISLL